MTGQRGMSLLEVVAALAVLGMTGLMLSEGFGLGLRIWERTGAQAEDATARAEALHLVRRLVESVEPPGPAPREAVFEGGPSRIAFLSLEAAWLAGGQGRRIEIERDAAAGEVRMGIADPAGAAKAERLVLFRGAEALEFRFLAAPAGATGHWSDRWSDPRSLPAALEMRVGFADGRTPVAATIPLRRRLAAGCFVRDLSACPGAVR